MWPTTLDMTRDECRGILRRLELETYSNVISTFRAQGGLSDAKVKILEELRNVFHITQDRHRAEARRAANDEQLCTIAEIISGPNTAYEWSKEGRRPYPLLPRTPAATAFAAVANGVAEVVTNENSKLPYPSETVRKIEPALDTVETENIAKRIVTKDPEMATTERKLKLKRSLSLAEHMATLVPESKKRTISVQSNVQSPAPTPVHSNTQIQQLYNSHSKTQSKPKKASNRKSTANARTKTGSGSLKTQKNAKNKETLSSSNKNYVTDQRNLHSYASNAQPATIQEEPCKASSDSEKNTKRPLIATSKKDITNNLSKLNMVSGIHTLPVQQTSVTTIATQQFKHHDLHLKEQQTTKQQVKIVYSSDHVQSENPPLAVERLVNNTHLIATPGDVSEVSWSTKSAISSVVDQSTIMNNKPLLSAKIPTKLTILSQPHAQNVLTPNVLNQIPEGSQIISSTSLQTVPQTINLKARNVNDTNSYKIISSEMALPKLEIISNPDNRSSTNVGTVNSVPLTMKPQNIPATSKQKVHITSQQIICPPGGAKIPQNIILKGFPSNKSVKIYSSPSGKMFIQSNDSAKAIAKVVTTKNILPNTTLATNVQSTINQPTNRVAVQKVQLLPTSPNKPVTFSKPNMVLMQTMSNNLLSQQSTGNVIVRSTPIKTLKSPQENEKPITDVPCSNVIKNQNNVIVIGAISSDKAPKDTKVISKTISESSMITEDTPVDILTTPITVIDDALSINQISKDSSIDLKSTNVSVLQPMSPVVSSTVGKKVTLKRENVERIVPVGVRETKIISPAIIEANITHKETVNYPGNTTDWEMELDQEAHKQARSQYLKTRTVGRTKKMSVGNKSKSFNDSSESAIDHFNEVIEETLDDDSMTGNEAAGEEDVEFDVSYVDAQEDTEESTGIEYIEDTTQSMSDDTMDMQDEQQVQKFHINTKINTPNYVECTTNGKATSDVRQLESSEVMFEMQEIDENGLSHIRRLTFEELIASGQVTSDLQESALTAVTNTKCISE